MLNSGNTAKSSLPFRLGLEENGDMQLLTVSEGQEDETFWKAVGGKRDYYNLLQGRCTMCVANDTIG